MQMRQCGRSGLVLPVLGLGCWSFGGGEGDYWGARQPGITCAITGVRSVDQLHEALAGANLSPPPGLLERLSEITEPLKHKLGANADYFQSSENRRVR